MSKTRGGEQGEISDTDGNTDTAKQEQQQQQQQQAAYEAINEISFDLDCGGHSSIRRVRRSVRLMCIG
jgi:hypothetical protein